MTTVSNQIICGDCLDIVPKLDKVDLVFGSPPYENAREYELGFSLKGDAWVDWAARRFYVCWEKCTGLTAWVVEGTTSKFRWSATPVLMQARLHDAGVKLRKPPIFGRYGISGSGGPDYLRNDYETIVTASHGRLPWSNNTAMGKPPKYPPGGKMSNRKRDGTRNSRKYNPPALANPGNVISCPVGGGVMGDRLCHDNEAPFPEYLAEFMILTFCPPGGTVLDPFCGSGTTLAMAKKHGRKYIGIDIRMSQCQLSSARVKRVKVK